MPRDFDISVVIPVFNGANTLRHAVDSVLEQPEAAEIVIVDDGSADGSPALAESIAREHPGKIRAVRHPDGGNHGAGASRNLGIESATCDWIAFLDADDYYLPGRFRKDAETLAGDPALDGAYDALGLDLSDDKDDWWRKSGNYQGLVTMARAYRPEHLFSHMNPVGIDGSFSTDAIVVHRRIFDKTGCKFSPMKFGEDTLLWMQMAAVGRLAAASIATPVAMRRVHAGNSIRSNTDRRATIAAVFAAFRAWDRFESIGEANRTAFRQAGIHLARDWRELAEAFRLGNGFASAAAWRAFLRWFFIRQFPEDPFLPGFMPTARRRTQR